MPPVEPTVQIIILEAGDPREFVRVGDGQHASPDVHHVLQPELAQDSVDVNRSQPQGIASSWPTSTAATCKLTSRVRATWQQPGQSLRPCLARPIATG